MYHNVLLPSSVHKLCGNLKKNVNVGLFVGNLDKL